MIEAYVSLVRPYAHVLLAAAPLAGAALAFAIGQRRVAWPMAVLVTAASALLALDLAVAELMQAPRAGLDGPGVFAAALVSVMAALTMLAGGSGPRDGQGAAPTGIVLALVMSGAWCAALLAADTVTLFITIEAAWIAAVGLVAFSGERDKGALNGALRMLTAGGVGAALFLVGAGMVAHALGGFELARFGAGERISAPALAGAGAALMIAAVAIKAGVAPLHGWGAAALGRSDGFAALAVSAIGVIGALGIVIRLSAYAVGMPSIGDGVTLILAALGAASVAIGSLQAIGAQSLQRMIGYALAAQAGCVLITLALGSPAALAAALVQVLAAGAAAFAVLGGAAAAGGARSFSALDGLGRRAPLASVAIALGALSMMGAPLTLGFLGRWRLIEVAVGVGWWWAAAAIIAASLAGVFYGARLIERVFFRRIEQTQETMRSPWRLALAPALAAAIAINLIGLNPTLLLAVAAQASSLLGGGTP